MRGEYCKDEMLVATGGFTVGTVVKVNPAHPCQGSYNEPEPDPWIPYPTLPLIFAWVGRRYVF